MSYFNDLYYVKYLYYYKKNKLEFIFFDKIFILQMNNLFNQLDIIK